MLCIVCHFHFIFRTSFLFRSASQLHLLVPPNMPILPLFSTVELPSVSAKVSLSRR
jgi:hypothetical protein